MQGEVYHPSVVVTVADIPRKGVGQYTVCQCTVAVKMGADIVVFHPLDIGVIKKFVLSVEQNNRGFPIVLAVPLEGWQVCIE